MKIRLILFLFLGLFLGACNEHTVTTDVPGCTDPNSINYNPEATVDDGTCLVPQKKQFGFVLEYTAKWCGPCGSWGAPQMHEIYNLGNVVGITAHADGDPMYNATLYNSFASVRPTGGGIPSFWVGDVSDGDVNDMQTLLQRVPVAGVACTHSITGNKMEVKALVEFFENLSGDFYLSVYLLESGIDGSAGAGDYEQNGTTDPDYKHDFVLRTAATPSNAYGESVISGSVPEGTQIRKDYTIDIDPTWNTEKVYAAVVLWKKDAGSGMYEFINAFEMGSHISH